MEKAKLIHIIEAVALIVLTVGVLFAVAGTKKDFAPQPVISTAEMIQPTPQSQSESKSENEWIPEVTIEYDAYTPSTVEPENFNETVILGNSQAQALSNYGLLKNADFVTRIGLSINGVLQSKAGTAPIADLYGKQYRRAIFIFGENELGWPYPKNFISEYKKVIARVRELNPGIEIYCQEIFPVSAEYSAKSTTGITNENVKIFNGMIEQMCAEIGAVCIPVSAAFRDETGVLPAGAATDGVHFNYDYCKIWAGDLSAFLEPQADESTTPQTEVSTTEGAA